MEAAALFILSSIYRKRAGGVMHMVSLYKESDLTTEEKDALLDVDRPIRVAIEAIKILIEKDRQSKADY
ncbi:MAG TPA: hypothetical protein PLE10_03130 [Brevefilum sp.]|nr:hypothetical protein [Brevefilum sp.]HOR18805.1 hypothetical protein [Brevefilum sp.]HPL68705.1 hypothetical protein [Brevefilum sp.]